MYTNYIILYYTTVFCCYTIKNLTQVHFAFHLNSDYDSHNTIIVFKIIHYKILRLGTKNKLGSSLV